MKAKTVLLTLLLLLTGSQLVSAQNYCRLNTQCATRISDEQAQYIVKKMALNANDAKKLNSAVAEYNKEKGNVCTTNCNYCDSVCKTANCKPGNCVENCRQACCNPNVKRLNRSCAVGPRHYNHCDSDSYTHHRRGYGHRGHGRHCR